MRDKIIGTVSLVMAIIVLVSTGTTFAYFTSTQNTTGDDIMGSTIDFDVDLLVEEIYSAAQLVPLEDSKITKAVNNNCKDSYGYEVCSLYKITLTNNSDPQILNAHITSKSETTYITENLKGQLLSSDLKSSVSSVLTLIDNEVINTEDKRYFYTNETNLYSMELTTSETLYLAIWLTETHDYQNDDYNKNYYGSIAFEAIGGEQVTAAFNS